MSAAQIRRPTLTTGASTMNRFSFGALLGAAALTLAGCASSVSDEDGIADIGPTNLTSGNNNPAGAIPPNSGFRALFQVSGGIFPYPYDAYFAGSTDGTLNLPSSPFFPVTFREPGSTAVESVTNALDGFSTTARITTRFEGAINPATLTPASVVVLQVTTDTATKGVTGLVRPLTPGTEYAARVSTEQGSNGGLLEIVPLRPLAAQSSYLVILTNGIANTTGAAATADTDFASIRTQILTEFGARPPGAPPAPAACTPFTNATFRALCQLTSTHILVAGAAGLNPANVIQTFSFSTQSINNTLGALRASVQPGAYSIANTGLTTAQAVPGSPGISRIYAGSLRVPYYLTPPSAGNPTAPLTAYWTAAGPSPVPSINQNSRLLTRFNPVPRVVATLDIPLLLTVPTVGSPGPNGWPVVIFQHGTPRTRGDALIVADSFAAAGFATIAIDLPLHGINSNDASFLALRQAGRERTFDLDLLNNTTGAPGPDGVPDETGAHFINLASLLTSRDNVRQAISDLMVLTSTIPTIDYDGSGTPDFDANRIHVVGYSLGAIVSVTLLGTDSRTRAAALPMGAAGLTDTLRESSFYGPRINAGLAANGLTPGSALYNNFFRDAQAAVDSADGINYLSTANAGGRRIHVMYIVGGAPDSAGGIWPADPVVPNSRTTVLTSLLGLPIVTTSGAATGNGAQVRLNAGIHNSYLDPRPSAAVTVEMQRQIAAFIATNGATVLITDPTVIAP